MFRSLFARADNVEYDFGERVVALRTKREVAADQGGGWLQRVKIRRLGDQVYLTGEVCDDPAGSQNPYKGVVFWFLLSEIEQMREKWTGLGTDIPLVIIESPYRALVSPLLKYIDEIDKQRPDDTLTVVLPEFIAKHWWEHLLHNQTALRIKAALLFRPGTVVISVPYHLERAVAVEKRV